MKSLITLFIVLFILTACGNSLVIENEWSTLSVTYYILGNNKRIEKFVVITEKVKLDMIRGAISINERKTKWAGVNDASTIIDSKSKQWNINFVFEDRLDICDNDTKKESYIYILNNYTAYDMVRNECLLNELKTHPKCVIDNIILRTNLSDEGYKTIVK